MSGWGPQPSQVQKTLGRDCLRILSTKLAEHTHVDAHLILTNGLLRIVKEAEGPLNPIAFEMLSSALGELLKLGCVSSPDASMMTDGPGGVVVKSNGSQLFDYFLDRLLACRWRAENLIPQLLLFRDLPMTPKLVEAIVDKVVALLPSAGVDETPAILYQLLLLGRTGSASTNANSMNASVFKGIVEYFGTIEEMGTDGVMMATDDALISRSSKLEAQCVGHTLLALKHNRRLTEGFLKMTKGMGRAGQRIPRFAMMLLLALCGTSQHALAIPELLKANILAYLGNAEVFLKHGPIEGIPVAKAELLEDAFAGLVHGLSFDAEAALMALIQLAAEMPYWPGTAFVQGSLSKLAVLTLRTIFTVHPYARGELLKAVLRQLTAKDSSELAILLDEIIAKDPSVFPVVTANLLGWHHRGAGWVRTASIAISSPELDVEMNCCVRRLILSDDDAMIQTGLSVIEQAILRGPDAVQPWMLLKFAILRLPHSPVLFHSLQSLAGAASRNAHCKEMLPFLHDQLKQLVGEEYNWPKAITACVDGSVGRFTNRLPQLLLTISSMSDEDDPNLSAALNNLFAVLDNQAGVKWFPSGSSSEDSVALQDLKRPVISDLYEAAVVLCLRHSTVPRAFRLLNRWKDFQASTSTGYRTCLQLHQLDIQSVLKCLLEDQLATNGADDLFKWILGKVITRPSEALLDLLESVLQMTVTNGPKLKGSFGELVQHLAAAKRPLSPDLALATLKWAAEMKLAPKEQIPVITLVQSTTPALSSYLASISTTDRALSKQLFEQLQQDPAQLCLLANDLLALLGQVDGEPDENVHPGNEHRLVRFKWVTLRNLSATTGQLITWLANGLGHIEWAFRLVKAARKEDRFQKESLNHLCGLLKPVLLILVVLSRAAITGPLTERFQAVLLRTYKLASALSALLLSLYSATIPFDLGPFKEVIGLLAGQLTPAIYIFIPLVQQMEAERAKEVLEAKRLKKAKNKSVVVGKQRPRKEAKLLPALIFNIELLERYILEFSSRCKIVLVDHLHRSTTRDFRIQTEELEAALEAFQLQAMAESENEATDEMPHSTTPDDEDDEEEDSNA